jgi:hypothetical protein
MPLYRYRQIPFGSVRISRGITMTWSGNSIVLSANLEVSGAAATATIASQIRQTIENIWNATFDDSYRVSCSVNMRFRTGGTEDSNRSQIFVTNDQSATNVNSLSTLYNCYMNYHLNTTSVISWTPAHEFGHMMGLKDHYDEGTWSRIRDICGYSRTTAIQPGWNGNIMAVHLGVLEKRNLQELFALHAYEMITIVEDAVVDYWEGLNRSIRNLYGVP